MNTTQQARKWKVPAYRIDPDGWPIERIIGRSRWRTYLRYLWINIRKIWR